MKRLVLDIGNTKTAIGVFKDGAMTDSWRIRTQHWTTDELWVTVSSLLRLDGVEGLQHAAFACVVPQVRHTLRNLFDERMSIVWTEVDCQTAGMETAYRYPHELGADRLANAVGALVLGDAPAIVADFGTATTFDVVGADGRYLGGAIAPGTGTAAGEMFRRAEKLNPVDLVFPRSPLGRTTPEAMRSGVLWGAVGAADRLVEALSAELEGDVSHWATGGWASGIAPMCRAPFVVSPELTLIGIDEIGRRNST